MNLKKLRAKMSEVDDKNISGNILREIVERFLSIIIFTVRKFYEKIFFMCFVGYFRIIQKFIKNNNEYYSWERVSTRGIGTSTTRTS